MKNCGLHPHLGLLFRPFSQSRSLCCQAPGVTLVRSNELAHQCLLPNLLLSSYFCLAPAACFALFVEGSGNS